MFDVETATIGSRLYRARQALHDGLERSAPGRAPVGTPDALDTWARKLADDRTPEK